MNRSISLIMLLSLFGGSTAWSQETKRCISSEKPKAFVDSKKGSWTFLSPAQYNFLRGIYAMNPNTPPGLPYGNGAVLATIGDNSIIFFSDGDMVCDEFPVPDSLVDLIKEIDNPVIKHEGDM